MTNMTGVLTHHAMIAFLSLLFVSSTYAGMTQVDLNCTTKDPTGALIYAANADVCSNVQSDAVCNKIYTPAVTTGGNGDRPGACSNVAASVAQPPDSAQTMAIATCPKTCGYCCLTPEYSCTNKIRPRINCAQVTATMCRSTQWRQIIAEDCPNTCGFCLLGGCIDVAPDCSSQPQICQTRGMEAFVAANCQRTCDLCLTATTIAVGATTRATVTTCTDNTSCSKWIRNGFCSSPFYTAPQKRQFCGKSCGLC